MLANPESQVTDPRWAVNMYGLPWYMTCMFRTSAVSDLYFHEVKIVVEQRM